MKKFLVLFVALATVFSFMSCDDEIMSTSIDDYNANAQWNYNLAGKTLTYSEANQTMDKTTTTIAGTSTSVVVEEIELTTDTYTIVFSEQANNAGTFTMTYTITATAAADTAYVSTAPTVIYDNDFDNTGYTGKVLYSSTFSGTYEIITTVDDTQNYILTGNSAVQVVDNNGMTVPTVSATYDATAGTITRSESYTDEMEMVTPGDNMFYFTNDSNETALVFPYFGMYSGGFTKSNEKFTVSE